MFWTLTYNIDNLSQLTFNMEIVHLTYFHPFLLNNRWANLKLDELDKKKTIIDKKNSCSNGVIVIVRI